MTFGLQRIVNTAHLLPFYYIKHYADRNTGRYAIDWLYSRLMARMKISLPIKSWFIKMSVEAKYQTACLGDGKKKDEEKKNATS